VILTLALAACSVIVTPKGHPEYCSEPGQDCGDGLTCAEVEGELRCVEAQCRNTSECDPGSYCNAGFCVPGCEVDGQCGDTGRCIDHICRDPQTEICNNIDDDLDGETDEGFDRDGDFFSSCEFVSNPPDCNDESDLSRPGLTEICDGLDNDCDNLLDEETCAHGTVCARTESDYDCVSIDNCENDEQCGEGFLCSPERRCVEPAGFGEPCIWDGQCTRGRCLVTYNLGIPGQHCTELCCSEADCEGLGQNAWCADNGSGLRLCAPPEWFGTSEVSCGAETCPSCTSESVCRQQCCGHSQCSDGCHYVEGRTPATDPEQVGMFMCDVRSEGPIIFTLYSPTIDPEGCRSGLMWVVDNNPLFPIYECTEVCCNADRDCPSRGGMRRCVLPGDYLIPVCYDASDLGQGPPADRRPYGTGTCAGVSEWDLCESGVCHPEGYCTRTCCPGDSCQADLEGRLYDCRPQLVGGTHHANLCTRE
jgi:hypothetical protein